MIRSAKKLRAVVLCTCLASGALASSTGVARGEVSLVDPARTDGWEVTTTGRVNSHLSWVFGETVNTSGLGNLINPDDPNATDRYRLVGPQIGVTGNPTPGGAVASDTDNNVNTMRIRGGFASTIFGMNIYKQVSPNVKLSVKLGMWAGIQNALGGGGFRAHNDVASIDFRDQFMRLDGKWGAVWGGRLVGLFNRGGMRMNWFMIHREGVGHPCNVDGTSAATCGHTGVGSLHPIRNAQLGAATPEIAGFQLSMAIFDPSMVDSMWNRTMFPRVEAEATFRRAGAGGNELNVWANGMHQVIGRVQELPMQPLTGLLGIAADATRTVFGYGGGAWGRLKGFALGATGWAGKGLGTAWSFGNTAIDESGELRSHFGYLAAANYRRGPWEVALGYGSSNVRATTWDNNPLSETRLSVIKEVRGISGKVVYHLGPVGLSVDGMNIRQEWHRGEVLMANVISGGMLAEW